MTVNPILEKLGFSDNDRVVVFHADDIGMCHASVAAYADLWGNSPLKSAATMVPCAWFSETARLVRKQTDADMGVHLTLTSEWDGMRWGPISTSDPASGLIDAEGYFYRESESVQANAEVEAVAVELRAQIERAKRAGIDFTHIDTHMGALFHPKLLQVYVELGFEVGVPAFGVRLSAEQLVASGYDVGSAEKINQYSQQIEARGMPLFDGFHMLPLHEKFAAEERLDHAHQVLDSAPAGLHYFIIHPAIDTPELRALAPDWQARVADYDLFMNDQWRNTIEASGVRAIGMKALRDLIRNKE